MEFLSHFRPLLTRSSSVQFVYDLAQHRAVYVSDAYPSVFGHPLEQRDTELPGWLSRVHPDDYRYARRQLAATPLDELVEHIELRVAQPDGTTQWLRLAAGRTRQPDGRVYLSGRVEDITRAKEVSLNAQKFNTKKNATLEILSHDLAAPMLLLQQLTEHLRVESQDRVTEHMQQLLTLMERTCTDGVALIRAFVDNEFLESVNVKMTWERADLGAWLATLLEEYQRSEWYTHLHFVGELPTAPIYIQMDVNKLQQVFNNLISNAIKFTPDGGTIRVRLAQREARAVVTVADTGVGIPEKLQPGLFDKFTKSRRPGLRGEKATGLGMSIIRTIVELHRGQVRFTSREGAGSTFTVELPTDEG